MSTGRPPTTDSTPALTLDNVTMTFGPVRALDSVSLEVGRGEVLGLLGANGSGKSTLIKVLAGFHRAGAGEAVVGDRRIRLDARQRAVRELGIRFIHQDLGLVPSLTVLENLVLPDLARRSGLRVDWRGRRRRAAELFASYDLDLDPDATVGSISLGQRAMLAIVRAVGGGRPSILVLDEPTVFLSEAERATLFALVHRLAGQGTGVILVSHDLEEVRDVCDRIAVLRDGRLVGTRPTADLTEQQIIDLMVGPAAAGLRLPASEPRGGPAVRITGAAGRILRSTDLEVGRGEVLGLTGLAGSGFEELPYLLYGARPAAGGRAAVGGVELDLRGLSPVRALREGVVLIPADRQSDGVVGELPLEDNLSLPVLGRHTRWGGLRRRSIRSTCRGLLRRFQVRPAEPTAPAAHLSGGNQQRAVLAKWLQTEPRVILLDEPTQGVDIAARMDIFRILREAAADGAAVVCASSDHSQLADLCDRVVVFRAGRPVGELYGADLDPRRIHEVCAVAR